ncbi:MAG: hypothetical protein H6729_16920 [Deltaproteobacteria bacterium]|nr:hypothetical protein [Deltaproteobacteria bacterium]
MPIFRPHLVLTVASACACACASSEEPQRIALPVAIDASGIGIVTNDLGYAVELYEARVMVTDFTFALQGEAHAMSRSIWQQIADGLMPRAYAHPGHDQAGDITGELRGRFLLNWLRDGSAPTRAEAALGRAELLPGLYKSANFTFVQATEDDGLSADDPILGHTAILRGFATPVATEQTTTSTTKQPDRIPLPFVAVIDAPEGRLLIGAPFELDVDQATTAPLEVRLLTTDPLEGDTLFDGIDFSAIAGNNNSNSAIVLSDSASTQPAVDAYNQLRRRFQTHDHFEVRSAVSTSSTTLTQTPGHDESTNR